MEDNFNIKTMKEVWQNQTQAHLYSENEIFEMMKRKSISSVKWIFYISLAEVFLTIALYLYTFWDASVIEYHNQMLQTLGNLVYVNEVIYVLVGIINLVFLYVFFRSYGQVNATSTVKRLTQSILNLKNYVTKFIYFNVSMSIILMGVVLYYILTQSQFSLQSKEGITLMVVSILTIVVILGVVWLYYYLLYGTFLRRLKNNLKELSNLEN